MKITHGLGGPKGILILVVTSVVGAVGILGVWLFRENLQSPPAAAAELSPDEVLRLAGKARGTDAGDSLCGERPGARGVVRGRAADGWPMARIAIGDGPAGGEHDDGRERIVGQRNRPGRHEQGIRQDSLFISRTVLARAAGQHARAFRCSFGACGGNSQSRSSRVTGWLRNISSQTLSQCTVVCTFQDQGGAKLDRQQGREMVLQPLEFVRFETAPTVTEKQFAEITIEISHATPDGLRDYLPAVVIPHSAGQRTQ